MIFARLAARTGRLPSEWAAEMERDPRSVWTVLSLLRGEDQRQDDEEGG